MRSHVMIESVALCACVLLALMSGAGAGNGTPVKSHLSDPAPECPLSPHDLKQLKELTFKDFDAEEMLMGPFTELWSSRFATKVVPFCLKTYVTRNEENDMLKQIKAAKNIFTNDQEGWVSYLQKLEPNVYLVRAAGDMKPVARIYIIFAHKNALATFQCSLTPMNPARLLLTRMLSPPKSTVDVLPEDLMMAKMTVISIRQSAISYPLPPEVEYPLNDAWEKITKHHELFGQPEATDPCILQPGDVEQNQVAPSQ